MRRAKSNSHQMNNLQKNSAVVDAQTEYNQQQCIKKPRQFIRKCYFLHGMLKVGRY